MSVLEIILMALGLAMDAFAVSLAASTAGHASNRRAAFRLAFHFGLFQFLMPVLGWALGASIQRYLETLNDWVAFGLLVFVGGHMVWAGIHPDTQTQNGDPTRGIRLIMLSTATSLDALAVGLSLALTGVSVWYPSLIIGLITSGMCLIAISLGNRLRNNFSRWATVAGGMVLILIGLRIVLEHKH